MHYYKKNKKFSFENDLRVKKPQKHVVWQQTIRIGHQKSMPVTIKNDAFETVTTKRSQSLFYV